MDQDSIALRIARWVLVVIELSSVDQADIRGATSACRIRCMRSAARFRDLRRIPFLKIHARRLMSVGLKAALALTRFRDVRRWKSICDLRLSRCYNDWMRS